MTSLVAYIPDRGLVERKIDDFRLLCEIVRADPVPAILVHHPGDWWVLEPCGQRLWGKRIRSIRCRLRKPSPV
jgi:hypothetical protein